MIPYDLSVAQVMMLFDEAVVERLKARVSDRPKINRRKIGQFLL